MRFGISTHLYHSDRLTRDHLAEIAGYGFEAIELFATRSHFDYHDVTSIERLGEWLTETGLRLHGIHAPIMQRYGYGPAETFSIASSDSAAREDAVRETDAALAIARRIQTDFLVVHLGSTTAENRRDMAERSLEEIHELAAPLRVKVAVEVIPNDLSSATDLVRMLEEDVELAGAGICLDFGHAHLMGDLADAIEVVSGHLITTHVHDNHRRVDDHLVPFEGGIDWSSALMGIQKIGYEGTLLFEVANTSTPADVLDRTRQASRRFETLLQG